MTAAIKKIQPWQITKIWTISKALGMEKDDVHALAEVESLKELDCYAADVMLKRLCDLQGDYSKPSPVKKSTAKTPANVAGMITAGQKAKIWALMYSLEKLDKTKSTAALGERLCGIIKKEIKLDATPKNPFLWITFDKGNKIIEVIKKYIENASNKGGGDNG